MKHCWPRFYNTYKAAVISIIVVLIFKSCFFGYTSFTFLRIPGHSNDILKALLKLISDLSSDDGSDSSQSRNSWTVVILSDLLFLV